MVDFKLEAAPLLGGLNKTIGDTQLAERDDLALVSVAIPLGSEKAFATALKKAFGLDLPQAPVSSTSKQMRAIRSGMDQILLIFPHEGPDGEGFVQSKLKSAGYTTDQSDNWVALELSGPQALTALERLCPLDLHPNVFIEGHAARTVMEHMGALIMKLAPEAFLLLSASSSAQSFAHAVEVSLQNVTD